MILEGESGLSGADYSALGAEIGDPVVSFILEAYSLQISTVSDVTKGTPSEISTVDAIVCDDVIVRCWNGTNQIEVGTLATEDSSDQSWGEATLTATGLDEAVPPSIATDDVDTLRIFWYDGASVKYFESTDTGGSWGAAQTVATIDNIKFLAATSLTACHYMRLSPQNNCKLGVFLYTTEWEVNQSGFYWPYTPRSFDAISGNQVDDGAASSSDIVAFTTNFPPLITFRTDGSVLVKALERVQGIAIVRYQNGKWSDHVEFDVLDKVPNPPSRTNLRLTKYGDWIFMTYKRIDGSASHPHTALAVSRSQSGIHWEMPYLLDTDYTGSCALLLKRGNHCYLVDSTGRKTRSPSVGYVGDAQTTHDLSDRLIALDTRRGDVKEVQATVSNPEGVLDSILEVDTMWQMRISHGYVIDEVSVTVQTILADLESISRSRELPTDHRVLVGRDALGRMTALRADQVQEWETQQMGGDWFESLDGTKYSGLRHTAGYAGHWEAQSNVLELRSGSEPGVAYNVQTADAWNGSAQCAIKVAATDVDDFAGLIFRGFDKYNFWHVIYDAEDDALKLNERKDNEDQHDPALAGKSGMGWSTGTWYWLKVRFRYNFVRGYTSTDGITWTLAFTKELAGIPRGSAFTFANIPIMRGRMGYYGHGYSEYSPTYPDIPWLPPPIEFPDPPEEWIPDWLVVTVNGLWITSNFTGPDGTMPTWSGATGDLPTADNGGSGYIHKVQVNHADSTNWWVMLDDNHDFDYAIYETTNSGVNWTKILDESDLSYHEDAELCDLASDEETGELYALSGSTLVSNVYAHKWNGSAWVDDDTSIDYKYGVGGLKVMSGVMYFWKCTGTTNSYRVVKGTFGGGFSESNRLGASTYNRAPATVDPTNLRQYAWAYIDGQWQMFQTTTWPAIAAVDDPATSDYLEGFKRQMQFWHDPATGDKLRYLFLGDWGDRVANERRHTTNALATYTAYKLSETGTAPYLYNIVEQAWKVSDTELDWSVLGADGYLEADEDEHDGDVYQTGHHILAMDLGDNLRKIYPKAGPNVGTAPYINSIPYDDGDLAYNGVQALGLLE